MNRPSASSPAPRRPTPRERAERAFDRLAAAGRPNPPAGFNAKKSVDAALIRERISRSGRSDREVLKQIMSEIEYCEAEGVQRDTTPLWRAEVERRLGEIAS